MLFILAVIGLTLIVTESTLLEPLHRWVESRSTHLYKLMGCNQCSGFWAGLLLAPLVTVEPLGIFACGCAGSFLATLGYAVLEYLERDV